MTEMLNARACSCAEPTRSHCATLSVHNATWTASRRFRAASPPDRRKRDRQTLASTNKRPCRASSTWTGSNDALHGLVSLRLPQRREAHSLLTRLSGPTNIRARHYTALACHAWAARACILTRFGTSLGENRSEYQGCADHLTCPPSPTQRFLRKSQQDALRTSIRTTDPHDRMSQMSPPQPLLRAASYLELNRGHRSNNFKDGIATPHLPQMLSQSPAESAEAEKTSAARARALALLQKIRRLSAKSHPRRQAAPLCSKPRCVHGPEMRKIGCRAPMAKAWQ